MKNEDKMTRYFRALLILPFSQKGGACKVQVSKIWQSYLRVL